MTFRAKPLHDLVISQRARTARLFLGATVTAFALHSFACSGDVHDQRSSTTSGTTTSSSSGGETGGFGGSGGTGGGLGGGGNGGGGGLMDGGSGPVEYVASNLFTHVPRFMIFKVDHTRNLCFRIWMEQFSGSAPLGINVTMPWNADQAEVTNNVDDCVMSMGFPPQPATFAKATSGMGTIVISGGFPCTLDVHLTMSFEPVGPWVPTNEPFDIDALNVDGGCG